MTTTRVLGFLVFAAGALLLTNPSLGAGDPAPTPRRVVSLNLCADELVLRLAQPQNVASVTWLSRDRRNSNVAEIAAGIPINHGRAEEIIALKPDLVIAGAYGAPAAVAMLKRAGIPLHVLGVPNSLTDVRNQIREIADLVGEHDRGEAVIGDMDRSLAAVVLPAASARPRAAVLNPNGMTMAKGTLLDDIMTRAGLTNVAAELAIDKYGQVPLETIVTEDPDVLILSASRDGPPALATDILRHPVLTALAGRTRLVVLPGRLWNCGGPAVVEAIERLRRVAAEAGGAEAPR
jgi:iron complex transport system substrate-binding protein